MSRRYTHIVIGAGAAGCAVAARLSEEPANRVLLLEAGGRDWNPLIHMPAGFTKLTGPSVNWGFETVPQPELNNRRMHYPQGRTLGGSTSINAMIYIRGNRLDYDEWRDLGNEGWGYEGVLPYFRKSENNERLADEYHGTGGPLNVTEQVAHNPISKGFVRAAQSLGIPFSHDFNGAEQAGVGFYDVTQRNVRRESAATAYLGPARKRKNLVITTHAQATGLIIENGRAAGVRYLAGDKPTEARVDAGGEVVVSGGAVNSPRLLLLSGIGPADELRKLGIKVVHDLPGVGKNFQDHMDVYLTGDTAPVSYNGEDRWDKAARHGIQYLLYKTGPVTACVAEAGAFVCSSAGVRSPDIQIHCLPAFVVDHGRMRIKGHGVTINTCNLQAEEHRFGDAALGRSARGTRHRPRLPPGSVRLEDLDGGLRAGSRDPERACLQGPHPQGAHARVPSQVRRRRSASTSSSGRRPTTTRSAPARWEAIRWRSSTRSSACMGSAASGSSTHPSCRRSSVATPRRHRS